MKFPILREDLSDDDHKMYETIDGYVAGPFCEHLEVTGSDCALYPQGMHCQPCTWSATFSPEAFESISDYRARLAKVPGYIPPSFAPMTTWSAPNNGVDLGSEWACRNCGEILPEESSVRREFCSSRCRSAYHRRQG